MASIAPDLVEHHRSAFGLCRRVIGLRRSEQQRKADQVEELGLRNLWVGRVVEIGGGLVRDHGLFRDDGAHIVHQARCCRGSLECWQSRPLRVRHRVRRDSHVIEERSSDEQLDPGGLCFAPEAPDEHVVVVHPAANPVAIGIIRIGVPQDLGFRDLREKPCAKKRNRVSGGADVGQLVGRRTP